MFVLLCVCLLPLHVRTLLCLFLSQIWKSSSLLPSFVLSNAFTVESPLGIGGSLPWAVDHTAGTVESIRWGFQAPSL